MLITLCDDTIKSHKRVVIGLTKFIPGNQVTVSK